MRFFFPNLTDLPSTVISASTENPKLPARNVANGIVQKVWRTGSAAGLEWISLDLGSSLPVASVILLGHTLKASDSLLKVEASSVADYSTVEFTLPLSWDAGPILAVFERRVGRYWRISFTKAAAETRHIGRLFLGDYFEPTSFVDHDGVDEGIEDLSVTQQGQSGQEFTDIRARLGTFAINFSDCSEEDATQFKTILSDRSKWIFPNTGIRTICNSNRFYRWLYQPKLSVE